MKKKIITINFNNHACKYVFMLKNEPENVSKFCAIEWGNFLRTASKLIHKNEYLAKP